MPTFKDLGISESLLLSLEKMKFETPTDIQAATIPLALSGKDLLASAQTGTGKTGAFSIPLVDCLLNTERRAIVLTPTRELAKQVLEVIRDIIGTNSNLKTAFLIGGEPIRGQLRQLDRDPRIIVGTPGRVNDHIKRRSLDLSRTDFLVIDETDRMLDMGFSIQIDEIIKHMPKKKQTLMFSATIGREIENLARKYLNNPERVKFNFENSVKPDIVQKIVRVQETEKYDELKKYLDSNEGSVIVFVNKKFSADKIAKRITIDGINAKAIHGDLRQEKREVVIKNFRNQRYRVLVATDVASRGLDVPHIEHVINYDLPQCVEDYIHRIGRTGRAGSKGNSVCFVTSGEERKSFSIRKHIDPTIKNTSSREPSGQSSGRYRGSGGDSRGFAGKPRFPRSNEGGESRGYSERPRFPRPTEGGSPSEFKAKKKSRNNDGTR